MKFYFIELPQIKSVFSKKLFWVPVSELHFFTIENFRGKKIKWKRQLSPFFSNFRGNFLDLWQKTFQSSSEKVSTGLTKLHSFYRKDCSEKCFFWKKMIFIDIIKSKQNNSFFVGTFFSSFVGRRRQFFG